MNVTGMFRCDSSNAFYGVVMDFAGSDNTAGAVTFGDVFNNSNEFLEWEFGIPVCRASSFTEFTSASQAFEKPCLVLTIIFTEFDVLSVGFRVIVTIGEGAS
jgi:hypothetical protein